MQIKPVATALVEALDGMTLGPIEAVHASTAVVLAMKLDEARRSPSASVSMAVPGIARELAAVLDRIGIEEGADGIDEIAEQRARRRGSAAAKG